MTKISSAVRMNPEVFSEDAFEMDIFEKADLVAKHERLQILNDNQFLPYAFTLRGYLILLEVLKRKI